MTGVLFLVLPLRCVNSKHVGSGRFDSLLRGIGFYHLIEKRLTPRLVFYVLGRDRDRDGCGMKDIDLEVEKDEKNREIHPTIPTGRIAIKDHTHSHSLKTDSKDTKKNLSSPLPLLDDWRALVRTSAGVHMKGRGTADFFCGDFSSVPSVEFSISMATVLKS